MARTLTRLISINYRLIEKAFSRKSGGNNRNSLLLDLVAVLSLSQMFTQQLLGSQMIFLESSEKNTHRFSHVFWTIATKVFQVKKAFMDN